MSDFLQRESDVLGEEFGTPTGGTYATADIDFDRAASAFPEISLDGSGDISVPPSAPPLSTSGSFSFDDFSTPPQRATDVKVTGDDEIEKFESEFPDIEVPQVRAARPSLLAGVLRVSAASDFSSKAAAAVWPDPHLCSPTRILVNTHPEPTTRRRRAAGHQVRMGCPPRADAKSDFGCAETGGRSRRRRSRPGMRPQKPSGKRRLARPSAPSTSSTRSTLRRRSVPSGRTSTCPFPIPSPASSSPCVGVLVLTRLCCVLQGARGEVPRRPDVVALAGHDLGADLRHHRAAELAEQDHRAHRPQLDRPDPVQGGVASSEARGRRCAWSGRVLDRRLRGRAVCELLHCGPGLGIICISTSTNRPTLMLASLHEASLRKGLPKTNDSKSKRRTRVCKISRTSMRMLYMRSTT